MMFSRILAVAIVIAATLWIGSGVLGRTEDPHQAAIEAPAEPQALFKVAVAVRPLERHQSEIVLSGRTEADDRATAVARTNGSIVELKVRRGAKVAEGDVIAVLSDEARDAQVAQAEALVEQRRVDLEAQLRLIERGVVAANQRSQLEAELRAAEAALAEAEAERDRGLVLAPIAGVVSDVPVTTGQAVQPNSPVAEIVALDPMLAVVELAERQLGAVAVGDSATVRLVTGETVEGVIRFISPTASEGTRTYRVDIVLDNPQGSIPDGVTAEVRLAMAPVMAMRLPRSALTFSTDGDLSVRIVESGGAVASVPVEIVEDGQREVWVTGPESGASVVVQGQDFVKDGQRVAAVEAAPSAIVSR
jgi:multidrug efflux system membrane fusion protein